MIRERILRWLDIPQVSLPAIAPAPASIGDAVIASMTAQEPVVSPWVMPTIPGGFSGPLAMDTAPNFYGWAQQGPFKEGLGFLGYAYLAELSQRPEYRRISEILAEAMTRRWIKLRGPEDRVQALEKAMVRFKVRDHFRKLAELDGFFGRAHLYLDFGKPNEDVLPLPITPEKIGKGSLRNLKVVEPFWCYPGTYNTTNPLAPDFYRPRFWYVMGNQVDASRLLTFVGREMPDMLKPAYAFGGLSMSQMAKPYVDNWIRTRQSVSDLIRSFSTMVLSTDLNTLVAKAGDLLKRINLFNRTRDNRGLMVLNKDAEELTNVTTPLGTLDKLQAQAQEHICSVSGLPLVVYTGITPAGLNASSDSEIEVFETRIHDDQEHLYRDPLQIVLNVLQLNEFGTIDDTITFEFVHLSEMSEAERADTDKTKADTAAVYVEMGAVSNQEARDVLNEDEASPFYQKLNGAAPEPEDDGDDSGLAGDSKEWHEEEHPRDGSGKFSENGGGAKLAIMAGKPVGGTSLEYDKDDKSWKGDGIAPERIKALAIPPGWSDVRISNDENSDLQVLGTDAKGRPQYRYSAAFSSSQKAKKFERVADLKRLAGKLDDATKAGIAEASDVAAAVRLMRLTGMRPGSDTDTQAKVQAFGATTLLKSHVSVEGQTISYDFIGKKGVKISNSVEDAGLAQFVSERISSDDGDRLFRTDAAKANAFIKGAVGSDYKSKDLRTLKANEIAASLVSGRDIPKTPKERDAAIKNVADVVSRQLGNTPAVALADYINPLVFSAWERLDG